MCSNSKAINLVSLLVQAQNSVLVDIVRCDDSQLIEPWYLESLGDRFESFTCKTRQVRKISRVDSNSNSSVAQIVQSQCHCAEVQQSAPEWKKWIGKLLVKTFDQSDFSKWSVFVKHFRCVRFAVDNTNKILVYFHKKLFNKPCMWFSRIKNDLV